MLPGDHFKIVTKSADNLAAGESHLPPGPERRRQRRNERQRASVSVPGLHLCNE